MDVDELTAAATVRALSPSARRALFVSVLDRRPDDGLRDALGAEEQDARDDLAPASNRQDDLSLSPPAIAAVLYRVFPYEAATLHRGAALYYAGLVACEQEQARRAGYEDEEVYHLWQAAAPERRERFDAVFRARLRAKDGDGCRAVCAAVDDAGGYNDPLSTLCRGIIAGVLTLQWDVAEALLQAVQDDDNAPPSLRARGSMEMALLYRTQGRYDDAVLLLERCRRQAEDAGEHDLLTKALLNIGNTLSQGYAKGVFGVAALEQAITTFQQAITLHIVYGGTFRPWNAWNGLGIVFKDLKRLDDAVSAYQAALALIPDSDRYSRTALTFNLAEVQEARGDWSGAQEAYEAILALAPSVGAEVEVVDVLLHLGQVQERRDFLDDAADSYQRAIAVVESLRARQKAEEVRAGFLGTNLAPYERLIALSLRRAFGEALAFETIERSKARAFIELLADRPIRAPVDVPSALLAKERETRDALAHLYAMGVYAGSDGSAAARAAHLEAALEDVYRQMRRVDARYTALRTLDPLPLAVVQRRLPDTAALLEFYAVEGVFGCLVVTSNVVAVRPLPDAAAVVARFHDRTTAYALAARGVDERESRERGRLLTRPRSDEGTDGQHQRAPASLAGLFTDSDDQTTTAGDTRMNGQPPNIMAALYHAVVAPLADLFASCDELYVVPHGALHTVPIHALALEGGDPLLARHRVSYAPSASILCAEGVLDRQTGTTSCLAIGYNGVDLRFAEAEALHIAALTGGSTRTGEDATIAALYREGARHDVLHLACHGVFNPDAPLASGLLLADGKLDAMMLMQGPRLHARLVVLSACDSGAATVLRGDELTGLTRAFLYAGARGVVVSLWPVDDAATALLMDLFYRDLCADAPGLMRADEALRRAQLALRAMTVAEATAALARIATTNARTDDESTLDLALPLDAADPLHPYADPRYWAAFTFVCDRLPA